jgi:hypothetical protein
VEVGVPWFKRHVQNEMAAELKAVAESSTGFAALALKTARAFVINSSSLFPACQGRGLFVGQDK